MATGIRVNIGSDITFLPAQDGKQAKAYARLAQAQYEVVGEGTDRTFRELDSRWFDGEFTGDAALQLQAMHQKGDALIVLGNIKEESREWEGREITSERFYANAFGPDASRYDGYTLQRKAKTVNQSASSQPEQQAVREVSGPNPDDAEAELRSRLNDLVQSSRLSPGDATEVMDAFSKNQHEPANVAHAAVSSAASMRLTRQEEFEYVTSVTGSQVTGESPLTWAEAEQRAGAAPTQQQTVPPAHLQSPAM